MLEDEKNIKVAISQFAGRLCDTDNNIADACRFCIEAGKKGAQLILFPEGSLNGNALKRDAQDFMLASEESFIAFQKISDQYNLTICIGFTTSLDDKLNNPFAIIQPNIVLKFQYKCARTSLEPEFLEAYSDDTRVIFEVDNVRIVIVICCEYGLARIDKVVADAKPDLILTPSAGHQKEIEPNIVVSKEFKEQFNGKFRAVVDGFATSTAQEGIARLTSNPLGFDGERWWPGNSFAISASGEVLHWLKGETFSKLPVNINSKIININCRRLNRQK